MGASYFGGLLANGNSRNTVALFALETTEGYTDLVKSYYQLYLHRDADLGGLNGWVGGLQAGLIDQQVIAGILGSPEFVGA